MTFKTASGTLSAAVADAGTFTVSYPSKTAPESGSTDEGDFYLAMGHKLVMGQQTLTFPNDFNLTFGTSSITITNAYGSTWPSGTDFVLQLEERGKTVHTDSNWKTPGSGNRMARMARADGFLIPMGAPDVADADGVSASQTVTGAGTAFLIDGALVTGGVAIFDRPRCVVAAWTNTAIITITGTDEYGNAVVEVSASGTSHNGAKAFKKVTGVTTSATVTSATVGTNDRLGLPVFLPSEGYVMGVMQDGAPLLRRHYIHQDIDQAPLIAGTSVYVLSPIAGFIERMTTVMTTAVNTTGGSLTMELETVAITGLTVVIATGSVGDIDTDVPTNVTGVGTVTNRVAERAAIEIVGDAAFDSTGALNVIIEVNGWGVFTTGIRTSNGAVSTSNDVRGTWVPPVACDGAIVFDLLVALPDGGDRGISQYAG